MQIVRYEHVFHPQEQLISFENSWGDRVQYSCVVHFMTHSFLEYQKSLFEDFFAEIHEQLDNEVSHKQFRKRFEIALQEFNLKLTTFATKIKQEEKFIIKGFIQIIIDNEYISSLIGPIGVIIIRKNKLAYSMSNDVLQSAKISSFADIVEGDVKDGDIITFIGLSLETYLDDSDIEIILQQSHIHEQNFLEELYELLQKRVSDDVITGIYQYNVSERVVGFSKKIQSKIFGGRSLLKRGYSIMQRYRHETLIFFIGLMMTFFAYRAITGFLGQQQSSSSFVDATGTEVVITIKDINKDIQQFDNISSDSDEKLKKYNEIQQKIAIFESQKKQQFDVLELKKILQQKYFKGFNTTLFASIEEFGNTLYKFSDQELAMLGDIKNIFWRNAFFIAGSKGVLLQAINQSARGVLIGAPVSKVLSLCTSNLKKDGFICQDTSYQLYNTNRQGFTQLAVEGGTFPVGIKDLETFRTTNLFALVDDSNLQKKGVYLLKYQLKPGKLDTFGAPIEYPDISALTVTDNTLDGTGITEENRFQRSSFAVDGSFLMWNKKSSKLMQFWRAGQSAELSSRELTLAGGNAITKEFSEQTRVITSQESKYVYLFDPLNQSFVVYRSSPLKNSEPVNSSYKLQYFFSFKFSFGNLLVKDVFLREGEKIIAYFLTDKGIQEVRLYEFIDQYNQARP